MADEKLSDADYHHGADTLAALFRDYLLRHAVEFEIVGKHVFMRVGKTEIVFETQTGWQDGGSNKMLVRAVDVRQS
jgi:hypothetical protein